MAQTKHYGLVEAGGTKLVLGLARSDPAGPTPTSARDSLIARHTIPTTTPPETLGAAVAWLRDETARRGVTLAALGIASFGPLELSRHAPDWGHITRTTKPHWSNTEIAGTFARAFACPVAIDTDVNGAALAEARWGAGAGLPAGQDSLLDLTIGTGVGGGFVTGVKGSHGRLLHGLSHPEMGHIYLPRHADDGAFAGACPFHGACLEGLAAGPAIIARWGASLSDLPAGHPGPGIIAWYLAHALCSFQAVLEPARIVLGGGVMATPGLLERVRAETAAAGKGYCVGDPADIIVPPGLGGDSGLLGALALAQALAA